MVRHTVQHIRRICAYTVHGMHRMCAWARGMALKTYFVYPKTLLCGMAHHGRRIWYGAPYTPYMRSRRRAFIIGTVIIIGTMFFILYREHPLR
jgi:hypothetical protein